MRGAALRLRAGLAALALALVITAPLAAQTAAPAPATAPAPGAQALADAIRAHGSGEIAVEDLREIACETVSHAPGALDCRWEQRAGREWHQYTTWLAMVGPDWVVLDAPIPVPDFERGRLKPLSPVPAP